MGRTQKPLMEAVKAGIRSEDNKATFREDDFTGLGASCDVVWGPRITCGLPTTRKVTAAFAVDKASAINHNSSSQFAPLPTDAPSAAGTMIGAGGGALTVIGGG